MTDDSGNGGAKTVSRPAAPSGSSTTGLPEYCGSCGGKKGDNTNSSDNPGRMLKCRSCQLSVHEGCTDGFGVLSGDGSWTCAICLDPKNATQCCCCETRSSAMMRRPTYPTAARSWIHAACLHANDIVKVKASEQLSMVCEICTDGDLKLVRCEHANCDKLLHVSCAFTDGCKLVRKASKKATASSDAQRSSSSSSSSGGAQSIAVCDSSQYKLEVRP